MIFVLLPCYNEEENLPDLLRAIRSLGPGVSVVAVDDGSEDGTPGILEEAARRWGIVVLRHPRNLGLRDALLTLFGWAADNSAEDDLLVTMDADGTHDPGLIPGLAEACLGGADVAIASRYVRGGGQVGVPALRRALSRGLSHLARAILGLEVRDVSSGYRCYRAGCVRLLMSQEDFPESRGFEIQLEILARLSRAGCRVIEVPAVVHYERKRGKSKLRVWRTVLSYARLLILLSLRR